MPREARHGFIQSPGWRAPRNTILAGLRCAKHSENHLIQLALAQFKPDPVNETCDRILR
jgi:hypothetical protein